jgi:malonyl CoA-acyl carrier protein transacylase
MWLTRQHQLEHINHREHHSIQPRNFIVTGPPRALYGLVANLHKILAPNGSDQSKVKSSKQKPVFSMRFLVVGVPFHSQYLRVRSGCCGQGD